MARWEKRRRRAPAPTRRNRPAVIPTATREAIWSCYLAHYGQWGPQVLAAWCRREGYGDWSATTVATQVADLREPAPPPLPPRRYEVTAANAMWSEDGTVLPRRRRKRELLVVQDECSRRKLNWAPARGPAQAPDVCDYLEAAFHRYGAPLVLKHDGAAIFADAQVQALLARYGVVKLTAPPGWPGFNGKKERSMRDVKSYKRALQRHGVKGGQAVRIALAMRDLNDERPRPVLRGRTAREAYEQSLRLLPDRESYRAEVRSEEQRLLARAVSRRQRAGARRRAVKAVILRHRLLEMSGDVSTDYAAEE